MHLVSLALQVVCRDGFCGDNVVGHKWEINCPSLGGYWGAEFSWQTSNQQKFNMASSQRLKIEIRRESSCARYQRR